jgi:aminoglycoside phosphotransferase (APT) family kinase protein
MKRLDIFFKKTEIEDGENLINGVTVPPLDSLLAKIDWDYLTNGTPSNFHGDLQFDNIIVTRDPVSNLEKFVLIDWRQDFGGSTKIGDLYYDLAKLYGGTTLSYQLIKEGMFTFDMSGSSVYYNFYLTNELVEAKNEYETFLLKNGYDLKKVKLLTALIFLNMAPMHHHPFDLMLYYLGKSTLNRLLNNV